MVDNPASRAELAAFVEQVMADYEALEGPFDETRLPEKYVLRAIDDRDRRARYLTLTAAINYKKETAGPDGLWRVCQDLLEEQPWLFAPMEVEDRGEAAVRAAFEDVAITTEDDPAIWYQIAATLARRFDGDVLQLLAANDYDAVTIREYMHDHGGAFPYLKGDKISSLWFRLMHEEVHELSRIESIAVPVDTHIRALTARLLDDESLRKQGNDEVVRTFWQSFCEEYDFVPVRIDQPLWLLQKYWDEWGRLYYRQTLDSIR